MIHYRISGAVEILTPTRNGQVVIRYKSGRTEIAQTSGLWADGGIKELASALSQHKDSWDYSSWEDSEKWHNGTHVS